MRNSHHIPQLLLGPSERVEHLTPFGARPSTPS